MDLDSIKTVDLDLDLRCPDLHITGLDWPNPAKIRLNPDLDLHITGPSYLGEFKLKKKNIVKL